MLSKKQPNYAETIASTMNICKLTVDLMCILLNDSLDAWPLEWCTIGLGLGLAYNIVSSRLLCEV